MKSKAVSKTFRLLPLYTEEISNYAKEQKISLSKALQELLMLAKRYRREKQLEKELHTLSKDQRWLEKNEEWADHNLS